VRFRVWAPSARHLTLVVHGGAGAGEFSVPKDEEDVFDLIVDRAAAGDRYSYRINGGELRPDPASRFQPESVHGPSSIRLHSSGLTHGGAAGLRPIASCTSCTSEPFRRKVRSPARRRASKPSAMSE